MVTEFETFGKRHLVAPGGTAGRNGHNAGENNPGSRGDQTNQGYGSTFIEQDMGTLLGKSEKFPVSSLASFD
jgi:hypothetical protein